MKLLYFTDLHWRGDTPKARRDNYQEAARRKLAEVRDLAKQHNCTAVLFGGDLTHTPDLAEAVVGDLIRELRQFPVPIYGVWGNTHDIWGDNPATLRRTSLGVVQAAGCITLLEPGTPVFLEEDGVKVQLTGQGYHAEMDRRDWRLDYCVYLVDLPTAPEGHRHWRQPNVDWTVHIVHGMLRTQPLMQGIPVTLLDDLLSNHAADITLTGHDHNGFGVVRQRGRWACNPGALMRLTAAAEEIERPVQVALITLTGDNCKVELVPLQSAASGPEVLDRSHIDTANAMAAAQSRFIEGIRSSNKFESIDLAGMIRQIAETKGISAKIRTEATERVAKAQEELGTAEGAD